MKKSAALLLSLLAILISVNLGGLFTQTFGLRDLPVCEPIMCRNTEEMILNATVRIRLQAWRMREDESGYDLEETIGHATLRDGRELVTHNHYALFDLVEEPGYFLRVVLYNSRGDLLVAAPLSDFDIFTEGQQTLVFQMKHSRIPDALEDAGVRSAEFADWRGLPIQEGDMVAQVEWDGERAVVVWTTIERILTDEGAPRLVLENGIAPGSSGGGVFWNGVHIANNWQSIGERDGQGVLILFMSVASLGE